MRPGRGVDGLASQQLPVGGGDQVGCGDAEFYLGRPVLGVQLMDRHTVGRQVGQQVGHELVHRQQGVRAIGGGMVGQPWLVAGITGVASLGEHELHLVARPDRQPLGGGGLDLELRAPPLVVWPGRAVHRDLASGGPRQRGLPGEPSQPTQVRYQPDVAGRVAMP